MNKQLRNPLKNSKLKAIFFFLVLATFFWVLTKFSRQYTATATATINYVNVPETTLITENNIKEISFDMSASGFEFLFYQMKSPSIDIDVKKYYSEGIDRVSVPKADLQRLISSRLNDNMAVRDVAIEKLTILLDDIISKKVPVIAETEFSFKDGFRPIDSIKISPDSIVVAGPSAYLDTIFSVRTALLSEKNIDETISLKASIQSLKNEKISFKPEEVLLRLKVSEFTQKEIVLPIEIVNIPEGTIIKLIPNVVRIVFNTSVEDFQDITANDFKLVCDFEQRNLEDNFMIPKLIESPAGLLNLEFDTTKIDFLIFK